jgi:precorrin isomerase
VKSQLKGKPVVQDISNVQNGIQTARLDDLAFEEIVVKEQDSEAPM